MSTTAEDPQDAITAEEMGGGSISTSTLPKQRNAFSELMASKGQQFSKPTKKAPAVPQAHLNSVYGRNALAAYTLSPETYPQSVVKSYDNDFVVIEDLFPKSAVHMLLLPRDPVKQVLHPFDALADPEFLAQVQREAQKLKKLVASELRRRFGKYSATEKARNAAIDSDDPPAVLPAGRDWEKDVKVGVHAYPSMTHLHIHVLSVDRFSERMKHRKHYNSFATPFFVPIDDFPLAEDDVRRHPGREGYLDRNLICWRCKKDFGNKFVRLKEHLEAEFLEWKAL